MSDENIQPRTGQGSKPDLPQGPIYTRAYKLMWLAYVLSLLGAGCLGLHRFYLGYTRSAVMMLGLTLGSLLLPFFGIYSVNLTRLVVSLWAIVDLFLIPGMTRTRNAEIAAEIDRELANRN